MSNLSYKEFPGTVTQTPKLLQKTHGGSRGGGVFQATSNEPEYKNQRIRSGKHPLVLWVGHLGLDEIRLSEIFGVSLSEYRKISEDPYDGPFHKLTSKMVMNFCHAECIHPANLGSLEIDFKQTLPPAILLANIKMARDSYYSLEDRARAYHAIQIEKSRYHNSFIYDPEFGRIAEKLEEFFEKQGGHYLDNESLHHGDQPWIWQASALLACEEVTELYDMRSQELSMRLAMAQQELTKLRVNFYIDMGKILGVDQKERKRPGHVAVKCNQVLARCMREVDMENPLRDDLLWVLRDEFGRRTVEGRNKILSSQNLTPAMRNIGKEFALEADVAAFADAVMAYQRAENDLETSIENLKLEGELVADELNNSIDWKETLSYDRSTKAVIVSRLFANRLLIAEYEGYNSGPARNVPLLPYTPCNK